MSKLIISITLLCTLSLLSACKVSGTYYKPSGNTGTAVGTHCRGRHGFRKLYKFKYSEIKGALVVNSIPDKKNMQLRLVVSLKKGYVLRMSNENLLIASSGKTISRNKFSKILARRRGASNYINATGERVFSGNEYNLVKFFIKFQLQNNNNFTVKLPSFKLNPLPLYDLKPKRYDLGIINFKKEKGSYFQVLNC